MATAKKRVKRRAAGQRKWVEAGWLNGLAFCAHEFEHVVSNSGEVLEGRTKESGGHGGEISGGKD